MKRFAIFLVLFLKCVALAGSDGEVGRQNLVRDDFLPDNRGGFVGWSTTSRGSIRSEARLLDERSPNGKPILRLQTFELFDNTGNDGVEVMPDRPLKLRLGAEYGASVYVRTKGIRPDNRCCFILHGRPWDDKAILVRLPADTAGAWRRLEIKGVFRSSRDLPDAFLSVYAGRALGPDAFIDIAEPTLVGPSASDDPADDLWTKKPFAPRVTPVDPLLDRICAEDAKMIFYYPGETATADEALIVRVSARGRTFTARFADDHRACVSFGRIEPGALDLKVELVGEKTGSVLATHDYRGRAREKVENPSPIRKLNNFVGEIMRKPLANGEYAFALAEEGWVYVGFSQVQEGACATVDGDEGVICRPGERAETMRFLAAGPHVIRISGVQPETEATFAVRTVKTILRQALHTTLSTTKNFDRYQYGDAFWRRLGLLSGFNTTSLTSRWADEPSARPILDEVRRRGVKVEFGYGMGSYDSRRTDFEQYLGVVTNRNVYLRNEILQFDENSFLPHVGAIDKVHTADIWWRAFAEGRHLNVFLDDAGTALYANPVYDIPELAAYLNAGDGQGQLYGEAYFRSVGSRAELNRYLDFLRAQFRALRTTNPRGPSRFSYLLCGWTMIGGYTPWYHTEMDMRAMLGEVMRTLATDPEFADCGGISFSFPACWEDFWRFVSVGMVRYYCIDGGVGDYAAMNGMTLFPGHSVNGDFLEGFAGWKTEPAEPDSIRLGEKKGFGKTVQGRQYLPSYTATHKVPAGDRFAELVRSAKAPNRLRQKLTGLEPGRVYQLVYTAADLETAELVLEKNVARKTVKPVRPIVLEAEVKGAAVIPDLCHTVLDFEKYGKGLNRTSRVVFRATAPEAEVTFSDWQMPDAPGGDIGVRTVFNAVMVHPYYYEDEAQLEVLKDLFRQAHGKKGMSL